MSEAAAHDPDALDALPPGAAIGGYTVRRTLGHGGFGITYEAHNKITGKEVAIKEFFPSSMARRDGNSQLVFSKVNAETISWALRKFQETTTTLCGLSHPNIVQVHDYVPANETGYMIMELVDGQTLEHWLRARPAPPGLDELHPILDPVMAALIYVHGRGLIHRDIAPDNILITREGRPVLIDFGSVSRDLSDAKRQAMSSTVGLTKRHYTAPEQMLSKARPTPEADVYSMGAVLYRALSGDKPVDGQERIDAVFRSQPDPYRPLAGRRGLGCPARAAEAVDRAMAVRPEGRLHKIADLRAALVPPAAFAVGPRITKGLVAGVAALVVLAALAGGLVGVWIGMSGNHGTDGDLARQRQEIEAMRAAVSKDRGELTAAKADVERQRADADAAGKDIDRQRGELEAARADMARQRGELDAVRADLDRRRGELEVAKAEAARQQSEASHGSADAQPPQHEPAQAKVDKGEQTHSDTETRSSNPGNVNSNIDPNILNLSNLPPGISSITCDNFHLNADETENVAKSIAGQLSLDLRTSGNWEFELVGAANTKIRLNTSFMYIKGDADLIGRAIAAVKDDYRHFSQIECAR